LADVDLRQLAKKVRAQGRGRDTVLAHITPAEAKLLKARGGRGSINPKTGLPEFEDDFDFGGDFGGGGDFYSAPTYEYYDEPAPQQEFSGDAGEGTNTTQGDVGADAARGPVQVGGEEVRALNAQVGTPTEQPQFGPGSQFQQDIYPDGGQVPQAYDAQGNPLIGAGDVPDPNTPEAREAESGGGISSLLNSLGLGGTGLSRLLGNTSNADLARLLAAGGATAAGVRAGNQAQSQAASAANQIRNIADLVGRAGSLALGLVAATNRSRSSATSRQQPC